MRNIYIDFDGTIIDSSARMYEVYKSIMIELGLQYLSKAEYWNLKKERQPYNVVLRLTTDKDVTGEYMQRFLEKVESPYFLKFNQLIPGALKSLSELKRANRLVLVTLRRSKENLYQELKNLNIFGLFDNIFDDFKEGAISWEVTAALVRKDIRFNKDNSIIVGDTEDTILAGSNLSIPSFLVLSGIRSENFLLQYNPTYILKDISELPHYLATLEGSKMEHI